MKTEQAKLSTSLYDDEPEEEEDEMNIKTQREQILTTSNASLLKFYSQNSHQKGTWAC